MRYETGSWTVLFFALSECRWDQRCGSIDRGTIEIWKMFDRATLVVDMEVIYLGRVPDSCVTILLLSPLLVDLESARWTRETSIC